MRTYTKLLATAFAGALALTIAPTFALAEGTDAVASVDGKDYTSLQKAIEADGEVTLLDDVTLDSAVVIAGDETINGNGFTITGASDDTSVNFTVNKGTLTLNDVKLTEFGDKGATDSGIAVVKVPANADAATKVVANKVTVDKFCRAAFDIRSGSFELTDCTISCVPTVEQNSLTKGVIAGLGINPVTGTITNTTITNSASTYEDWDTAGVEVYNNASVTITGGAITDSQIGVSVDNYWTAGADSKPAEVTVDGTTVTAETALRIYGGGTDVAGANVAIKGGTFGGEIKIANPSEDASETIAISGGTFTTKPADEFLAEGFVPFEDEDGNFTAVSEDKVHTVTIEGSEPVEVLDGTTVAKPADPTARAGYTFAGWTVDGKAYDFATPVTSDLKIEQSWTLNAPKVTITPSAETLAKGETITLTAKAESDAAVTFAFEWVNGAVDKAGSAATAASTATGSLQVNAAGTYSVKVTATDADGLTATATASIDVTSAVENVTMYRLYNKYTGEHFYTSNTVEREVLIEVGWNDEGVAWTAPGSGDPVYRLFNPYADDHHFTMNEEEYEALQKLGWQAEDVAWYSADKDDEGAQPLYRLFNPFEETATHLYTADKNEYDVLETIGWSQEGIAWYGLNVTDEPTTDVDEPAADDEQTTTDTEKPAEDEKPAEEQPETDADAK